MEPPKMGSDSYELCKLSPFQQAWLWPKSNRFIGQIVGKCINEKSSLKRPWTCVGHTCWPSGQKVHRRPHFLRKKKLIYYLLQVLLNVSCDQVCGFLCPQRTCYIIEITQIHDMKWICEALSKDDKFFWLRWGFQCNQLNKHASFQTI